jgi:hypothetical protein
MKDFSVVLKVCEACGALWLRSVDQGAYCKRCERWLAEFPTPGARSLRRRGSKVERISQERRRESGRDLRLVGTGGSPWN